MPPLELEPQADAAPATRVCPACSHARRAEDVAPAWQCPRCGVAYDKVLAGHAARQRQAAGRAPRAAPRRARPWTWIALGAGALSLAGLVAWKLHSDTQRAAEASARRQADAQAQAVGRARADIERGARLAAAQRQWHAGDYAGALAAARAEAEAGDLRAMVLVAQVLYGGSPREPKNPEEGRQWLERAAREGFVPAMLHLGYVYEIGLGVPQQVEQSESWYARAARQGDADGLYALGSLYARGPAPLGQRPLQAHVLLDLAARAQAHAPPSDSWLLPPRANAADARYALRRLAATMPAADAAEARRRADAWRPGLPLPL